MAENRVLNVEEVMELLDKSENYRLVFTEYRSAIMEIETKLRVLDNELSIDRDKNPIEAIHTRLKSPESILEKMRRKLSEDAGEYAGKPAGYRRGARNLRFY